MSALVNISGHIDHRVLLPAFRRRVYVDIDPGFTQAWFADGVDGHRLGGVMPEIGEIVLVEADGHWLLALAGDGIEDARP